MVLGATTMAKDLKTDRQRKKKNEPKYIKW